MEFHGISSGLAIILSGMAASILLVVLARGLFTEDETRQARDITGNLLSVVGTLYAVLLGLIVVDVMVRFERAIDNGEPPAADLPHRPGGPDHRPESLPRRAVRLPVLRRPHRVEATVRGRHRDLRRPGRP